MSKGGGKIKWGIWTVVILLLIALAGWFLLQKPRSISTRITLPDGTSARILAVTYGTNHVVGTKLAQFTARLPPVFQGALKTVFGQRALPLQTLATPTPELLVWLDRETNHMNPTIPGSFYSARLGNDSNFISGGEAFINNFTPGFETQVIHFNVFPRRDREISLNIFDPNLRGANQLCGSLFFRNPLYRKYPEWQAEPLPAKKSAGDLEVTLEQFETGHGNGTTMTFDNHGGYTVEYNTDRNGGENGSVVYLKLRPLGNTNEVWQVTGVEMFDATGNSTHSSGMSWNGGISSFEFTPSLWPGEAAWKLKMEIKRTEGFRPGEIFTFKHVPLGEMNRTNVLGWSTNINGVTVNLRSISRRAPTTNNNVWSASLLSNVHFTYSALSDGTQVDLLRMICDTGKTNVPVSWSSGGNEHDYSYRDVPADARTANFVFAVQQSRFVEFTVKPELPKVKAESKK